jgi:hypothetical protein
MKSRCACVCVCWFRKLSHFHDPIDVTSHDRAGHQVRTGKWRLGYHYSDQGGGSKIFLWKMRMERGASRCGWCQWMREYTCLQICVRHSDMFGHNMVFVQAAQRLGGVPQPVSPRGRLKGG